LYFQVSFDPPAKKAHVSKKQKQKKEEDTKRKGLLDVGEMLSSQERVTTNQFVACKALDLNLLTDMSN